uniref:67A n=2 Tax=Orthoherpesviridae TaxID=3044472 RepID=Q9QAI0_MHV68|nr:67A [Murid gammaherpesvirus 4]
MGGNGDSFAYPQLLDFEDIFTEDIDSYFSTTYVKFHFLNYCIFLTWFISHRHTEKGCVHGLIFDRKLSAVRDTILTLVDTDRLIDGHG